MNDLQPINQNEDNRAPLILNDMEMDQDGDDDDSKDSEQAELERLIDEVPLGEIRHILERLDG